MKKTLPALLCFACAMAAKAQVVTYSEIVGFERLTVGGNGGSGNSQLTFSGLPLVPATEASGLATSASGTTVTSSAAIWTDDQFNGAAGSHYLEVAAINGSTTAAGVGTIYNITDTAAPGTVTLASSLAAGVTAPFRFIIRKHWTLARVFGATNSVGLQGGTATSADQIHVWNNTGYDVYYYQTAGIGGTGWRKAGSPSVDASQTVIDPARCMVVKRAQSDSISLTVTGVVKPGLTTRTIVPGHNFVPNPSAIEMTLSSCGLYTGNNSTGIAGGSSTSADQVLIWNGSGYDTYYYQTEGIGGTGWRKTGDQSTNAAATVIAAGSGFIVRRLNPGSFTWVIPQHPASF
ncbi:MAG: TIGR02597 family protein [Verrucomicrobiaceae bacterium]|nr:TIGR02597 family protein [Verrucomicrobiaceae bacterium]